MCRKDYNQLYFLSLTGRNCTHFKCHDHFLQTHCTTAGTGEWQGEEVGRVRLVFYHPHFCPLIMIFLNTILPYQIREITLLS